jgi:type IV pilus assembly protein PilC
MILGSRVSQRELAQLSRRLATALEAGLDVRKVWIREAERRVSPGLRRRLTTVAEAVALGRGISDGLAETGEFFPPLFRAMTHVGEQTGKSAEVFRQLADHYDHQLMLRRMFLAAIAWPMLQLTAAIVIIGLLIWILGMLPTPVDILGFGLMGNSGLAIYLLFIGSIVLAFYLLFQAMQRGVMWTRPIQRLVLRTPWLGTCLQTLALSRMAWSLHVTLETGMDLREVMSLSLASTHNARYMDHTDEVISEIVRGNEVYEALEGTGVFPRDFLDAFEVGERSGRLPESMAHLSQQYQDQARRALATLTVLAGFGVWAAVAAVIIMMIFRLAFFYINTINDALRM